jgi:hypothetical protein
MKHNDFNILFEGPVDIWPLRRTLFCPAARFAASRPAKPAGMIASWEYGLY